MWPENVRPTIYGHWPAWQITIEHSIDPADGEELLQIMESGMKFTVGGNCRIKNAAVGEAKRYRTGLVMRKNGSKLDHSCVGPA